ncbi:Transcription factor IIS, N-terminal, partial [Cynara cardunculus var. scolymus]
MTLEDFFTLTELRDGLTTPTRVNELLTVMQKEKDCVVKNVGEATRQWSAVACTIATTENKDCLDLFIQLDGLWFIDRWLKDAQKFGNDTENRFLEELIIALLRALERLQVDNHRSISSGIDKTVQDLLGHSSSMVREKAKALCEGWTPIQDIDVAPTDVKMIEAIGNATECPAVAISNEENMEQSSDQKMLKEEMPTQETIMESASTNQDPV